jgi:hypothetical protein
MAQSRFRNFPLFLASKKFAEAHGNAYNADSGDELQFGSDGILGLSDGIITVRIEADYVVPVAGTKIDLWNLFLNKTEFYVRMLMGGKSHQVPCRITNMAQQSESKGGTATGKITMMATATPDVT